MIKPEQSRAARGLLGWTQDQLAIETGFSKPSIINFERDQTSPTAEFLMTLKSAFEFAGVSFIGSYGVTKRHDEVEILNGNDALRRLWDNIFLSLKQNGGEVLITNVDEKRASAAEPKALAKHLERLKKHNIRERLLSCKGDTNFLMPIEYYRWISKDLFTFGMSSYIYDGKVALQLWESSMIILIRSNDAYEAEKRRFEYLWKKAEIPKVKIVKPNKK